jgi:hypothetical protein
MDERERHADGLRMRRRVLGDAHVDRAIARTTPVAAIAAARAPGDQSPRDQDQG